MGYVEVNLRRVRTPATGDAAFDDMTVQYPVFDGGAYESNAQQWVRKEVASTFPLENAIYYVKARMFYRDAATSTPSAWTSVYTFQFEDVVCNPATIVRPYSATPHNPTTVSWLVEETDSRRKHFLDFSSFSSHLISGHLLSRPHFLPSFLPSSFFPQSASRFVPYWYASDSPPPADFAGFTRINIHGLFMGRDKGVSRNVAAATLNEHFEATEDADPSQRRSCSRAAFDADPTLLRNCQWIYEADYPQSNLAKTKTQTGGKEFFEFPFIAYEPQTDLTNFPNDAKERFARMVLSKTKMGGYRYFVIAAVNLLGTSTQLNGDPVAVPYEGWSCATLADMFNLVEQPNGGVYNSWPLYTPRNDPSDTSRITANVDLTAKTFTTATTFDMNSVFRGSTRPHAWQKSSDLADLIKTISTGSILTFNEYVNNATGSEQAQSFLSYAELNRMYIRVNHAYAGDSRITVGTNALNTWKLGSVFTFSVTYKDTWPVNTFASFTFSFWVLEPSAAAARNNDILHFYYNTAATTPATIILRQKAVPCTEQTSCPAGYWKSVAGSASGCVYVAADASTLSYFTSVYSPPNVCTACTVCPNGYTSQCDSSYATPADAVCDVSSCTNPTCTALSTYLSSPCVNGGADGVCSDCATCPALSYHHSGCDSSSSTEDRVCKSCLSGQEDGGIGTCNPAGTASCSASGEIGSVTLTCTCKGGFTGTTCNQCSGINYGNACTTPCGCDADGSNALTCNKATGVCSCKTGFKGDKCNQCTDNTYGAACSTACNCDSTGSSATTCNRNTGACSCNDGFKGTRCDQCSGNNYGSACTTACGCDVDGSVSGACSKLNGTCTCKDGFTGPKCDQCSGSFHGVSCSTACACDTDGSTAATCNRATGACGCKGGVTGLKCDACAPATPGRFGANCTSTCDCGPNGRCDDGKTGTGACVCSGGWQGSDCRTEPPSNGGAAQAAPIRVFAGDAISITEVVATEGQAFSYSIPRTAVVVTDHSSATPALNMSAKMTESAPGSGNFDVSSLPSWLVLQQDAASPSGWKLVSTSAAAITRARVTYGPSTFSPLQILVVVSTAGATRDAVISVPVNVMPANHNPAWTTAAALTQTIYAGRQTTVTIKQGIDYNDDDAAWGDKVALIIQRAGGAGAFISISQSSYDANAGVSNAAPLWKDRWDLTLAPSASDIGTTTVSLVLVDSHAATGTRSLVVTVEAVPAGGSSPALTFSYEGSASQIAKAQLSATQGSVFMYSLGSDAFVAVNGALDPNSFTVTSIQLKTPFTVPAGGSANPCRWLKGSGRDENSANPNASPASTATLSTLAGTPSAADAGIPCAVTILAKNADQLTVSGTFTVIVTNVNDAPSLKANVPSKLPSETTREGQHFSFPFNPSLFFEDADTFLGDRVTFTLAQAVQNKTTGSMTYAVSDWIAIECFTAPPAAGGLASDCSISGRAPAVGIVKGEGQVLLAVIAADSHGATAFITLPLTVLPPLEFSVRVGDWGACSKACGGGRIYRTVDCVDEMGTVVASSNCPRFISYASRQACNTENCTDASSPYKWTAGVWQQCSASCIPEESTVLPTTTRTVLCVDSSNGDSVVAESLCNNAVPSLRKPSTTRYCNTMPCALASALQGSSALPTVASASAQQRQACSGVLDLAGNCCNATAPSGYCCASSTSSSSTTGLPNFDDCKVCDGTNSCPVRSKIIISSPALVASLCVPNAGNTALVLSTSPATAAIVSSIISALASRLGVLPSVLSATSLQCIPPPAVRRLSEEVNREQAAIGLEKFLGEKRVVQLVSFFSNSQSQRYTYPFFHGHRYARVLSVNSAGYTVGATIGAGEGANVPSNTFANAIDETLPVTLANSGIADAFVSSMQMARYGTCGNGICEIGETCLTASCSETSACPQDCPLQLKACPLPTDTYLWPARQCSGHGSCSISTGSCVCSAGYSGLACDSCANGFTLVETSAAAGTPTICVSVEAMVNDRVSAAKNAAAAPNAAPAPAGNSFVNSNEGVAAISVSTGLVAALAAGLAVFVSLRRRDNVHNLRSNNSSAGAYSTQNVAAGVTNTTFVGSRSGIDDFDFSKSSGVPAGSTSSGISGGGSGGNSLYVPNYHIGTLTLPIPTLSAQQKLDQMQQQNSARATGNALSARNDGRAGNIKSRGSRASRAVATPRGDASIVVGSNLPSAREAIDVGVGTGTDATSPNATSARGRGNNTNGSNHHHHHPGGPINQHPSYLGASVAALAATGRTKSFEPAPSHATTGSSVNPNTSGYAALGSPPTNLFGSASSSATSSSFHGLGAALDSFSSLNQKTAGQKSIGRQNSRRAVATNGSSAGGASASSSSASPPVVTTVEGAGEGVVMYQSALFSHTANSGPAASRPALVTDTGVLTIASAGSGGSEGLLASPQSQLHSNGGGATPLLRPSSSAHLRRAGSNKK